MLKKKYTLRLSIGVKPRLEIAQTSALSQYVII